MLHHQFNDEDDKELPVTFGMYSTRQLAIRDFTRMAHLLIGGVTGYGKSMFLHSFVCSFVKRYSPEQIRFVLMDSRRSEFRFYAKLPHLYSPVAHGTRQGITILKHVEAELARRLTLFGEKGCRNIADFSKANEGTRLPYLIVVVDELSDFMVGSAGAFESTSIRIAATGRSAGVHLAMATSCLDARVLSDNLKANIPGRLAFRVCRKADSLALLGEYGAEKLTGHGDALLKDADGMTSRLQAPHINNDVVKQIVDSAIARYSKGGTFESEDDVCEDSTNIVAPHGKKKGIMKNVANRGFGIGNWL